MSNKLRYKVSYELISEGDGESYVPVNYLFDALLRRRIEGIEDEDFDTPVFIECEEVDSNEHVYIRLDSDGTSTEITRKEYDAGYEGD